MTQQEQVILQALATHGTLTRRGIIRNAEGYVGRPKFSQVLSPMIQAGWVKVRRTDPFASPLEGMGLLVYTITDRGSWQLAMAAKAVPEWFKADWRMDDGYVYSPVEGEK